MYAEIGGSDGAMHKFNAGTEIGYSDGANHKIKLIEIGGADGTNHIVWRRNPGDFFEYIPSNYAGTHEYYDHGDYLYGNLTGRVPSNTDTNRAVLCYIIAGLNAGDVVEVIWSASAGYIYSNNYMRSWNTNNIILDQYYGTEDFTDQKNTITMSQGGVVTIGIDHGSTRLMERWFKISQIKINGEIQYP
ncbi:hypothetical protein FL966_01830 [Caproiciproducens galactitolivorans]|uniref:Uncharacterized protein n=1 Tax=Caproiciproducens galactitolivorans TaxID=642589 RepID=A0A4Z0Y991_9FIRM|nr:hypothetical protein [Caproiciproducens galactitolivorans]QEY33743.1 hypothetical protein FL966_00970 [Caproiciproducens galactitolivorans]QEY33882.1 hypothetical protein FL966_01830 [Caproiciproducens galactitolivorans]TGJ75473.1 hypothetical protein CAGA_23520 [Caproiciproducens galactitolivorans]